MSLRGRPLDVIPSFWRQGSLHRGFLAPLNTDEIRTSLFCPVRTLAETGKVVEAGDVLAELDTTDQEKRLRVLEADSRMKQVLLEKADTMATLPLPWLEQKWQRAKVEMQRRNEELEKAIEAREWKKILQTRENIRVYKFEQDLLDRRIKAGKALAEKGFTAKLEELMMEKDLTLVNLEASFSTRLLPWLLEVADEKEVLQARLALESASEGLHIARLEKETQTRLLEIDRETAKMDLQETQTQLDRVKAEIASSVIRAPFQGVCVRMSTFNGTAMEEIKEGDRVFPGIPFLAILRGGKIGVEFMVSQQDIGLLKEGWKVEFKPDSFPEYVLSGVVVECAAMAMEMEMGDPLGERTLRVRATLENVPTHLRYGLSGTVFLISPEKKSPAWQFHEDSLIQWRTAGEVELALPRFLNQLKSWVASLVSFILSRMKGFPVICLKESWKNSPNASSNAKSASLAT